MFHSALTERFVYIPATGGTVLEVDRASGAITRRLGTFGSIDPNLYVTSPIVIDDTGNLYYNALRVAVSNPWSTDHFGAYLVKITPAGDASRVSYTALVPGAPGPMAPCTNAFPSSQEPSPPSPDAVAPSVLCGSQRAGINIAPAVGADGTIYTVSRTHLPAGTSRWGWLVAMNQDLTPRWATSMRNRFQDGCNVLVPPNGTPGGCRTGAATGVDPSDNQPGSGHVNDNSTSSPVVAPDGSIYYGAYTNTLTCSRRTDGSLQCSDDRPEGFEWCVNAVAVDSNGVVYVNSEDGNLYAIGQGGALRERIFLQLTLGAAYTPLSLGADGRVYTQNAGILFAVGANTKKRRAVRP